MEKFTVIMSIIALVISLISMFGYDLNKVEIKQLKQELKDQIFYTKQWCIDMTSARIKESKKEDGFISHSAIMNGSLISKKQA